MAMDMDSLLSQQWTDLMRELVEKSSDKAWARRFVNNLTDLNTLRAYRSETSKARYAGYKKTRDAMKALFADEDRTLTEEEIKVAICDQGGFRRGAGGLAGARMAVQKSIKLHLHGDGAKTWPLKMLNGLIGPKDWDDARFGVERSDEFPDGELEGK